MLLTIVMVTDESNPKALALSKQMIVSQLAVHSCWKGNYEIIEKIVSVSELSELAGKYTSVNSLLAHDDLVRGSQGEYVWVLPCFLSVKNNPKLFDALFGALSLGITVVGLSTPGHSGGAGSEATIHNSPTTLLPMMQQFEEFRYIVSRNVFFECFANEQDFVKTVVFLSHLEANSSRMSLIQIPCNLEIIKGITSSVFLKLDESYFSGYRAWDRQIELLPNALHYHMVKNEIDLQYIENQKENFRLFFFSACSALDFFAKYIFNENDVETSRDEVFLKTEHLVSVMEETINLLNSLPLLLEVMPLAKLAFFIQYWKSGVEGKKTSQESTKAHDGKVKFDGIWWLESSLKNEFYLLGEERFKELVQGIRMMIENSYFR